MHSLFTKYDQNVQQRFRSQQSDIARLFQILQDLQKDESAMWQEVVHLRQTVDASASPKAAIISLNEVTFNSVPNEGIIKANCKEHVNKQSVVNATAGWLAEAGFRDRQEFEYEGSDTTISK